MPGTTDTVKAKLTPGEFVIRKEAVDMIGVPMLNKLNNMPEEGGHSAIDRIISMATLSNMKMMYGGGMVKPNYAGGGMVMDQYGHGGKVKKNLKPMPQGNPGLGKLPESVRNKMGYMQEGGEVENSLMGMRYGGMAKKKKMMGYQDGGFIGPMPAPAPNDPLQIEARQANPEMYSGSTLGVVQDQAMMLQDSIEQDTINKARKSLQLLKLMQVMKDTSMQDEAVPSFLLDSSAELLDSANPSMMMNNNQAMESSQARNLDEYLKMQAMSRGMGAVRQGMGNEPMSIVR
jgi:hypothetical protein